MDIRGHWDLQKSHLMGISTLFLKLGWQEEISIIIKIVFGICLFQWVLWAMGILMFNPLLEGYVFFSSLCWEPFRPLCLWWPSLLFLSWTICRKALSDFITHWSRSFRWKHMSRLPFLVGLRCFLWAEKRTITSISLREIFVIRIWMNISC